MCYCALRFKDTEDFKLNLEVVQGRREENEMKENETVEETAWCAFPSASLNWL